MTYIVPKLGNSLNFVKYTHEIQQTCSLLKVLYKETSLKNNTNINNDNFTNLLLNFLVKTRLKNSLNKRNFAVFFRWLECNYVGCPHPVSGESFKNNTSVFIGSYNFSRIREPMKNDVLFKKWPLTGWRHFAWLHTRHRQNTVMFRLFLEFLGRTLTRKVANKLVKLSFR